MAKVAVVPAVYGFSDLRPSSRALTITPRPASRKSTAFGTLERPSSRNVSRGESDLVVSPRRSKGVSSSVLIITPGRRDSSDLSLGSPKSPDANLSFIEIESRLREKIRVNAAELRQAFQTFDAEKTHTVTQSEFKRALESFCIPLTEDQFDKLIKKVGTNRDGTISYLEFLERYHQRGGTPDGLRLLGGLHKFNQTKSPRDVLGMDEIESQLRRKMGGQLQSVMKALRLFDYNRDGQIQKHELRRVIENFCFRLTDEQFNKLWCKYDMTRNGHTLEYMDFLKRLGVSAKPKNQVNKGGQGEGQQFVKLAAVNSRPRSSQDRKQSPPVLTLTELEHKLRKKMIENHGNISRAFVAFDRRGDGFVTLDELKRVLFNFAFPMSDKLFVELMDRCGIRANHKISYEQFLEKFQMPVAKANGQTIPIKPSHKYNPVREAEEMPSTDDIWKLLHSKIMNSFSSVKQAFLVFDDNKDGRVTKRDFRRVLESFCFRMSQKQFHELMAKIDPYNKGYVSYLDFLDRFEQRETEVLDSLGLYMTDDQFRILSARLGFHKGKLSYMEFLDNFQDRRSFGVGERVSEYPSHRYNLPVPQEESMKASVVEARLRTKLRESFQDLRAAFQKIDYDRNGLITRPEFRRILDSFMFLLSDEEFDKLMLNLGIQKGAKLNYREFLKRFEHVETVEEGHPWLYSTHSFNETQDMNYLTAEQADQIIRRKAWEQNEDLSKAFLAFDRDGNGIVTKKELKKVLYQFQIPLNKEEFKKLWDKYDTDKNGYVDHREFLAKLGGELAPGDIHGPSTLIAEQSQQVMESMYQKQQDMHVAATWNQAQAASFLSALEVEQQLRDRFRDGYESLRKAFETVDTNRDGYISRNELKKVLFDFHYFLDDVQLNILLDRCGLSQKNKLSYERFLSAFQDNRHAGYGRVTLDTPGKVVTPVVFERHESLSPDAAINRLRNKIGENPETIQRAFAAFDREGVGLISKDDLHQIINAFCFVMSEKQFQALLKKVNVGEGGLISYDDFLNSFQKSDAEASRRWLENLYPSSDKRQKTADHVTRRPRGMSEAEVEKRVREVVVARFYSLAKAFTDGDTHHSGTVSASSLHEILNEHAFRMTSDQFYYIWNKLPKNPDGTVDYKDFLKIFSTRPDVSRAASATSPQSRDRKASYEPAVSPVRSPVRIPSPETVTPPPSASDVERNIKDAICRRWQHIQKSFRNIDNGNKGTVSFEQLKDVLWKHDIHLGPSELLSLWKKHSNEERGGIVYKDFMRHFVLNLKSQDSSSLARPKLQPTRVPTSPGLMSERLIELMATIRAPIRRDWKEMRRAFRALDKSGAGTCSLPEFRQMMRKFKMDLNEEEFFHLFSFYDKNMTGRISYNDFLRAHLE
ncbi:EF-hand calcium-binding domain-containing protein 6-like [Orbicella faveolata]|uniref:EF-hand calcium-binding domain-containing protein 6-like n=1 Tax=Orbicella faveolata TaxID=48498 RepID=UPI0009E328E8|nr:EF-hand calcium-binding domain-containing protein 6-like [Orbicella faveolata]